MRAARDPARAQAGQVGGACRARHDVARRLPQGCRHAALVVATRETSATSRQLYSGLDRPTGPRWLRLFPTSLGPRGCARHAGCGRPRLTDGCGGSPHAGFHRRFGRCAPPITGPVIGRRGAPARGDARLEVAARLDRSRVFIKARSGHKSLCPPGPRVAGFGSAAAPPSRARQSRPVRPRADPPRPRARRPPGRHRARLD